MKLELLIKERDIKLISQIARRAKKEYASFGLEVNAETIIMDLTSVHFIGENPIKLQELLVAETDDFMHDIIGINQNLNRITYKLENCFSPRYSL